MEEEQQKSTTNFIVRIEWNKVHLIEKVLDVSNVSFSGFNILEYNRDLDRKIFSFINNHDNEREKITYNNVYKKYFNYVKWVSDKNKEYFPTVHYANKWDNFLSDSLVVSFYIDDKKLNTELKIQYMGNHKGGRKFSIDHLDTVEFEDILDGFMGTILERMKKITFKAESMKYNICEFLTDRDTIDEDGKLVATFMQNRYNRLEKLPKEDFEHLERKMNRYGNINQADINNIYFLTKEKKEVETV